MEQKYLYLHTEKTLADTEEILKSEGMQIVFKSDHTEIKFSDMTEGEKLGWFNALEDNLSLEMSWLEKQRMKYERGIKSIEKKLGDVISFVKDVNVDNVDNKFEDLVKKTGDFGSYYVNMDVLSRWAETENDDGEPRIYCSCLIAKTENDVVRYLSFLDDPVLSITGPNSSKLKSTLENKF